MKKAFLAVLVLAFALVGFTGCAIPDKGKINTHPMGYNKTVGFPAGPMVPGYGPFND
jgi:hypothetical protein